MTKPFLLSILFVLLIIFNSSAQNFNCVKGEFLTGIAKSAQLTEAENRLCAEIKEQSDLQQIYGFVINPQFGQIVRFYQDRVVFTYYEDYVRFSERDLTAKEIENLRNLLVEVNPKTQSPIRDLCVDMCVPYEFLSIDRNEGARIAIFSERYRPPKTLDKLAQFFNQLCKSGNFRHFYYIQNDNRNFKILLTDNVLSAQGVWKKGDDFRVLVRDYSKWAENFAAALNYFENSKPKSGLESYEQRLRRLERRDDIQKAYQSWRKFENGKLSETVSAPDEMPYFDTDWRFTANGHKYLNLCVSENDCALVKTNKSLKPVLIRKGNYETSDIVVSPDGRWLITSKEDQKSGWENLVRINIQTNQEFPINLELSYDFDVIAYLAARNSFLVRQRKQTSKQKDPLMIMYLLDAETGKFEKVEGNFAPLILANRKPLQATTEPNIFWAAQHDYKGTTQFGIYNTSSFTFRVLAQWSKIEFDSDGMWVDEKEMEIYFVYNGHLLSLPLPKRNL